MPATFIFTRAIIAFLYAPTHGQLTLAALIFIGLFAAAPPPLFVCTGAATCRGARDDARRHAELVPYIFELRPAAAFISHHGLPAHFYAFSWLEAFSAAPPAERMLSI